MQAGNLLRIMFRSVYNKKMIAVILLAMSGISVYMTDVIMTDYFSDRYRTESMEAMFGEAPDKVSYVECLNYMDPEYSFEKGSELMEFIRGQEHVTACGRFCNSVAEKVLDGEDVKALVIEKDIAGLGNLGITDSLMNNAESGYSQAYIGYKYRKDFKIGDTFDLYRDTDASRCIVAGYLKDDASWPLKGNLFGGVSNLDSYTLEEKIVVITDNYDVFNTYVGMPDIPYYIIDDEEYASQVELNIYKKASEQGVGVKIVNEAKAIQQKKEENNITEDKSFSAMVLLFLLAVISMSAASIVFCLIRKKQQGIMMVCGISRMQIIGMNFLENALIVVLAMIAVWFIRQKEIFGKALLLAIDKNVDMIMYPYWYGHCVCVPIVYIVVLFITTVLSGIVPAVIIGKMSMTDIIRSND